MRLEAEWLKSRSVQTVMQVFEGAEGYFVGGCVRNEILGAPVSDFDIATNLHPEDVTRRAEALGLKVIPTGIEHGTVTVICGDEPFEITTYRKDIETNGRHAQVRFSKDIVDDAARRDFSMNALYLAADGAVIDPLGGLEDLNSRCVRFIGDPEARIKEDYLRILRFFRFHAWYGDKTAGLEPLSLSACASNLDGLEQLSRERVGSEILKLLKATEPSPSIGAMEQTGVLNAILPGAASKTFFVLTAVETVVDAIARLAAFGGASEVPDLRLSKADQKKYMLLREYMGDMTPLLEVAHCQGEYFGGLVASLRAALFEHSVSDEDLQAIALGSAATFPVSAQDLMPKRQGKEIGDALEAMRSHWLKTNVSLKKEALLEWLENKND